MLDGVFNHTGFVSRYFNGDGYYPEPGAVQSESSPYRPWFQFRHWPDQYESWWGIYTPACCGGELPGYREFILGMRTRWSAAGCGRGRTAGAWMWLMSCPMTLWPGFTPPPGRRSPGPAHRRGVGGRYHQDRLWGPEKAHPGPPLRRADELPLPKCRPQLSAGRGRGKFVSAMEALRENYPSFAFYSAMNSLGTHDTPPHHHSAWGGQRVQGPEQGLAGLLPYEYGAVPAGKGAAESGGRYSFTPFPVPHNLLRR